MWTLWLYSDVQIATWTPFFTCSRPRNDRNAWDTISLTWSRYFHFVILVYTLPCYNDDDDHIPFNSRPSDVTPDGPQGSVPVLSLFSVCMVYVCKSTFSVIFATTTCNQPIQKWTARVVSKVCPARLFFFAPIVMILRAFYHVLLPYRPWAWASQSLCQPTVLIRAGELYSTFFALLLSPFFF